MRGRWWRSSTVTSPEAASVRNRRLAGTASPVALGRSDPGNITTLRGLEPSATPDEVEAAARQYVRKVSGVQKTSDATAEAFERAVVLVTAATRDLLADLPPRKVPPKTEPPLRRIARASAAG